MFKLINYEQNKNLLQKIPHIKILDLAIIFNCLVDADETGNATILIYNQHLSLWNITKDDLYHLAMKNTPALLTYELRDMSDVLIELMAGVPCNSMKEEFEYMVPMYVLSNKSKLNGSGCIFTTTCCIISVKTRMRSLYPSKQYPRSNPDSCIRP